MLSRRGRDWVKNAPVRLKGPMSNTGGSELARYHNTPIDISFEVERWRGFREEKDGSQVHEVERRGRWANGSGK